MVDTSIASLLLLTDARFPDGTHAHSYGLEAAVADGRLSTTAHLHDYIEARLWTTGRTDAAVASLAAGGIEPLDVLDAALEVRTPGRTARRTSRSLGRSLLRTAERLWPDDPIARIGGIAPMQPVALGAVASRAGCTPTEAALCVTHSMAAAFATAALRLLGLDPFSVTAVLLDLRPSVIAVAASVGDVTNSTEIPHLSTPLAELDPELQQLIEPRLFGS